MKGDIDLQIIRMVLREAYSASRRDREPLLPADDRSELFWVLRAWPYIKTSTRLYQKRIEAAYSFLYLYSEADIFRQEPSTQAHVDAYLQAWEPLLAQKDY